LANHLTEEKADSIKLFAHWKTKNRGNLTMNRVVVRIKEKDQILILIFATKRSRV